MLKIINKRLIFAFLICAIAVSSLGVNAFADGRPGVGWKPMFEEEHKGTGTKVIVSEPHWGWAAPDYTYKNHVNVLVQVNGRDEANYHVFTYTTTRGNKCVKAYESVSRKYYDFKGKCYDDVNDAVKVLVEKEVSQSLSEKLKDALPIAVVAGVVYWIVKILVAFFTANPLPLLV